MTDIRKLYKMVVEMEQGIEDENIGLHDSFDIELNENFVIETGVIGFTHDGIVVEADELALELLEINDVLLESEEQEMLSENPALLALGRVAAGAAGSLAGDALSKKLFKNNQPAKPQEDELDELKRLSAVNENPLTTMMAGPLAPAMAIGKKFGLGEEDELEEIKRLSAVSERFDDYGSDSSEEVKGALFHRLRTNPRDMQLISDYGLKEVMDAIEDIASGVGSLEEIGSSDISAWMDAVRRQLKFAYGDKSERKPAELGPEEHWDSSRMGKVQYLTRDGDQVDEVKYSGRGAEAEQLKRQGYPESSVDAAKSDYHLGQARKYLNKNPKKHQAHLQQHLSYLEKMNNSVKKEMSMKKEEVEQVDEAEYQGRKVPLGKPMKGDVKKSKVYVKKPNGKVVKVNFGDKNMRIKKSNPARRKSFRARHNCDNPGPRWKARYWSCRAW